MEGSVPYTVILQSIKIPCLKKRWEMAAIQNLGAWGSICWSKFPFVLQENKSLNNSSCPWPAGVCAPSDVTPSSRWEPSPGVQGHPDLIQLEASRQLLHHLQGQLGPFPFSRCAPQRAGARHSSGFLSPQSQENVCMCWGHEPFLAVWCYSNGIHR